GVGIILFLMLPALSSFVAEGVSQPELKAREVGGDVFDSIVHAVGVDGLEYLTTVSQTETAAEGVDHAEQEVTTDVVLAAKAQATPAVASQTNPSLTAELAVRGGTVVLETAIADVEALFQLEFSAQAVAEIFSTA